MATDTTEDLKEMTDLEREHYEEIKELNQEFRREYAEWEMLKDSTSAAKKRVDEIGKRLSYLIARGPDNQQKLPFPDADQVVGNPDAWRNALIVEALGLTAKELELLEGAGITTVGQLEDLRAGSGLTSIKGIGQGKADKIEDQVLAWLDENRDKFGEVVSEESEEEETDDDSDVDL